ncbi:MAG: hypothetical protein ACFFBH_00775 [Promethearchaeota archaeon]
MIVNDMNIKVKGKFFKEVSIEDDNDDSITYVFPDTSEFIAILKRKLTKDLIKEDKI